MPNQESIQARLDNLEKRTRDLEPQVTGFRTLFRELALRALGDTPETASFIDQANNKIIEESLE
jgi:hypothetical protein